MKFLKILFIFALILFPFGELLRFDVGKYVAIKPLDIVVGLIAVWWIVLQVQDKQFKIESFKKNYFLLPLVSFVVLGFISLLINLAWLKSQEFLVSLLYLVRFISYALLLPVVLQFDKSFKKKISVFLLVDGLLIVVFGYLQYFLYNSLKNLFYLGWDEHMHRIFSTFFDPNFAGAFFVLYLIFVGGLLSEYLHHKQKKKIIISFFVVVAGLTLLAVFLTFSRAAFLMLFAGSIVFFVFLNKKKLLLVLFGVVLLFVIIASPKFYDENMNLFREASSKARIANVEVAMRIIKDRPLFGVGFNSYRYTKSLYGLDHDWVNAPSHADAGVDNSYLFVLATTGIIGFLAYGWLWTRILKHAFSLKQKKYIGATIVIASVFALFTNAFFINSLFFTSLMLWMWVQIGLLEEI